MNATQEAIVLKQLQKRIIDITYKNGLSHLSSTLSSLPIIFEIYEEKKEDEIFILSNGHAGLALYVVLEYKYGIDAEVLLAKHGIHPSKDLENHIHCSTGSLGQGIAVAVGHAVADRSKNVYCLISDGESAEGSVWEALKFKDDHHLDNLIVYANLNGLSAYEELWTTKLHLRLKLFCEDIRIRTSEPLDLEFTRGLESHYHRITDREYMKYMSPEESK